jgi:hypothetical protein
VAAPVSRRPSPAKITKSGWSTRCPRELRERAVAVVFEQVEIIFARRIRRDTKGTFRTAIRRDNGGVIVNLFYKHSRVKQYLKDGRAMRMLLVPLTATDQPQAPPQLRQALRTLDHHVDNYIHHARLTPAA